MVNCCYIYRPPNLEDDKGYGIFVARERKAGVQKSTSCTPTDELMPKTSILRKIGDHVGEIQAEIEQSCEQNTPVARRVAA